jgi:hypothetical protein
MGEGESPDEPPGSPPSVIRTLEDQHMATHDSIRDRPRADGASTGRPRPARRSSTETKAAFKTTEMIAYVAAVVAVLIAGAVIDSSDAGSLGGRQVWLYVTILTVGYMVSRGLAKSGSRDPYWDDDDR